MTMPPNEPWPADPTGPPPPQPGKKSRAPMIILIVIGAIVVLCGGGVALSAVVATNLANSAPSLPPAAPSDIPTDIPTAPPGAPESAAGDSGKLTVVGKPKIAYSLAEFRLRNNTDALINTLITIQALDDNGNVLYTCNGAANVPAKKTAPSSLACTGDTNSGTPKKYEIEMI